MRAFNPRPIPLSAATTKPKRPAVVTARGRQVAEQSRRRIAARKRENV